MDVKEAIETRRSIRKYKKREISNDIIKEIIDAARLAPSAHNAQPSRFFIVKDEETKNKLKENKVFNQGFVYTAPVIVVCCSDPNAYPGMIDWDEDTKYPLIDISISSAFLVLRATELGLGTCCVAWFRRKGIKEILDIPHDYVIPFVITLGYPDEQPKPTSRKSMEEILLNDL